MVRRLRGRAGRAGRVGSVGLVGLVGLVELLAERFFQSIHHHQQCIDLEDFYIAE